MSMYLENGSYNYSQLLLALCLCQSTCTTPSVSSGIHASTLRKTPVDPVPSIKTQLLHTVLSIICTFRLNFYLERAIWPSAFPSHPSLGQAFGFSSGYN